MSKYFNKETGEMNVEAINKDLGCEMDMCDLSYAEYYYCELADNLDTLPDFGSERQADYEDMVS